jgi:hypothetical protein
MFWYNFSIFAALFGVLSRIPAGGSDRRNIHWRVVRVVEGARLESVYTSKGYRGFESLTLRIRKVAPRISVGIFVSGQGVYDNLIPL